MSRDGSVDYILPNTLMPLPPQSRTDNSDDGNDFDSSVNTTLLFTEPLHICDLT